MADNSATLALVHFLHNALEMNPCGYCDRTGDGREDCEGCGASPEMRCIGCTWHARGWCDAPAHLRCPIQRIQEVTRAA